MSWFVSKSAVRYDFPAPVGFEAWFYTGPSFHFGHFPPKGKKK
jgi:hypothetical protein